MKKILCVAVALVLAAEAASAQIVTGGAGVPTGECRPGMFYQDTDALKVYACTTTNTWEMSSLTYSPFTNDRLASSSYILDNTIITAAINSTGVVSGCAVTPQGTPDMTVAVASGVVQVVGVSATVSSGNVTITAADATHPRIDLVTANGSGVKSVVTGTPAATPEFPTTSNVVLAAVYVPAGTSSITSSHIVDKRAMTAAGGTLSVPITLPAGAYNAPSLSFAGTGGLLGFHKSGADGIAFATAYMNPVIVGPSAVQFNVAARPGITDDTNLGLAPASSLRAWKTLYLARSVEGSKEVALTAGAATTFVRIAIPQTALVNFAAGEVIWSIRASDGTDTQTLQGRTAFNCANKGGTEGCAALVTALNTAVYPTAGATKDDLVCTLSAVTGLTDEVGIAANCETAEMTETSLAIYFRLDMPQPNTVTPST